jgi:hypothetical protein
VTIEERYADLVLESVNLFAEGGLRNMQSQRGAAEVEFVSDRYYIAKKPKLNARIR